MRPGGRVALAAPSTTATPAAATASAAHVKHRGEHGEFTGQGKAHRSIDFQRGTVTSVSGTSMTVRSADGFTQTYTFGPKIKVRKEKQNSTTSQIQTNDRIFVAAVKESDGLRAFKKCVTTGTPRRRRSPARPLPHRARAVPSPRSERSSRGLPRGGPRGPRARDTGGGSASSPDMPGDGR